MVREVHLVKGILTVRRLSKVVPFSLLGTYCMSLSHAPSIRTYRISLFSAIFWICWCFQSLYSNGLWLLSKVKWRPYNNCRNSVTACTTARASVSSTAYLFSVSLSTRDAKAMGFSDLSGYECSIIAWYLCHCCLPW